MKLNHKSKIFVQTGKFWYFDRVLQIVKLPNCQIGYISVSLK